VGWVAIALPSYLVAYDPVPVSESIATELETAEISLPVTSHEDLGVGDEGTGAEQNNQGDTGNSNGQEFVRGRGERRVNRLLNPTLWARIGMKSVLIFLFPFLLIVTGFFNKRELTHIRNFIGRIRKQGLLGFIKGLISQFRGGRKEAKEARKAKQERNRKQRQARLSGEMPDEPGGVGEGHPKQDPNPGRERGGTPSIVREAMRGWIKEQRDAGVELSPETMNIQREKFLRKFENEGAE
jgi:hypothetical protein